MSIAVVCPSRGRPDELARMTETLLLTSDAHLLVYLDKDDPTALKVNTQRVHTEYGPPIGRGPAVNVLCDMHRDYRGYLVVSDDIEFIREGWDKELIDVLDSFPGDIGLAHLQAESKELHVNWACVSRKWVQTLGYWNHPSMQMFCQDTALQALAMALDRCVQITPPALKHHALFRDGWDERLKRDEHAFLWYIASEFGEDLAKLRAACR